MAPPGTLGWSAFEQHEPDLAAAGRALLTPDGRVSIGFLATVSRSGTPHVAPVCPIACDGEWYLSVGAATVKRRDLDADGGYALHAFLGENDAEFQIAGVAERIDGAAQRQRVHEAIRFGAFGREDPIYRLWIARALHVYWENVGQPGTRPVRRRYVAKP